MDKKEDKYQLGKAEKAYIKEITTLNMRENMLNVYGAHQEDRERSDDDDDGVTAGFSGLNLE